MSIQRQTELVNELHEPKRYIVFMLNDDYTSWEFCLRIITTLFHKTLEEAEAITKEIHTKGKGLCGVYTYEIAETKAYCVQKEARLEGFPMKCSLEEA